ncbi:hypothetical protein CXG81DRAFT_26297 [Caulochytrium protostelioides]|uniref:Uncharacterized protein n=1 Tax=Caulochytrium protostelioides TaxID=1555241 RepID=A0A4P9X708_9FUNG|nr:hypothetical protein CXG81DRAFT_26297 [Caulochytrium protostelioides]|eukprot:RKP00993.1 hypothetical protein CXG81DRAFT_26297 [Caulochytrium protostelioides]
MGASLPDAPESVFEDALGTLFQVTPFALGEPGEPVELALRPAPAPAVRLRLANPAAGATGLMAHYVWQASRVLAAFLLAHAAEHVAGRRVLELGAGAGLPSIACHVHAPALGAAPRRVVVSDMPDPDILAALAHNMALNAPAAAAAASRRLAVTGHRFGDRYDAPSGAATAPSVRAEPAPQHPVVAPHTVLRAGAFDRVLAADVLWLGDLHSALLADLEHFLAPGGAALLVAGLHTGPHLLARFYRAVQVRPCRLSLASVLVADADADAASAASASASAASASAAATDGPVWTCLRVASCQLLRLDSRGEVIATETCAGPDAFHELPSDAIDASSYLVMMRLDNVRLSREEAAEAAAEATAATTAETTAATTAETKAETTALASASTRG